MKVLIADDSVEWRRSVAECFRRAGHEVTEAGDGVEALSQAQAAHPDVIVLDTLMPVMDGIDALQRLKADARTTPIPVAMLIAMPADARPYPAISRPGEVFDWERVDLVVIKPLLRDPSELVSALERLALRNRDLCS